MKMTVSRKAHFNAAHRLYRKDWTNEKNAEIFGKCSNPNFHGHNYNLTVSVTGKVNPETGFVIDLKLLSAIIETEVEDVFDHKNLNAEVPEFDTEDGGLNPTAENIAIVIYNKILPQLDKDFSLEITLHETERNFVTYSGN